MKIHIVLIFELCLIFFTPKCHGSWGTPGLGQYHIQTDEGPERYFRYQTDSGQYRKEKRLQDGTVIGTDAWIDASGFLRQKDYIADNQGYRILKSKTIYVGKGRPIEEAMRYVKNLPAQAGTLAKHDSTSAVNYKKPSSYGLYSPPTTATAIPTKPTYPTTVVSSPYLGYDHYPSSTPKVFIRPHSQPFEDGYYFGSKITPTTSPPVSTDTEGYYPTTTASSIHIPSKNYEPPYQDKYTPIAAYPSLTTSSPITGFGGPIAVYPSSTTTSPPLSTTETPYPSTGYSSTSSIPVSTTTSSLPGSSSYPSYGRGYEHIPSTTPRPALVESSTPRPIIPLGSNDLYSTPLYSRPSISSSSTSRPLRPWHPDGELHYNNHLGSGYDPQYALYDGVSATNNGFRYYLPRQYHEEDNHDPNNRAGSFGYIDPFGIRRVIYYNASPEQGFVHRKNNRYVGFNATPYDPRPL